MATDDQKEKNSTNIVLGQTGRTHFTSTTELQKSTDDSIAVFFFLYFETSIDIYKDFIVLCTKYIMATTIMNNTRWGQLKH